MFSIGDFARHGRVSVRMLRHYDAIGLLPPAYVDEATGYRSYDAAQLALLNRIVALKDLGFTLQQVQSILHDKISVEELRGMLRLRLADLHTQIAQDTARLGQVEARLLIIEKEGIMPQQDIQVKTIPAVRVAELSAPAASFEPASVGPAISPLYDDLWVRLDRRDIQIAGPAIAYYEDAPNGDGIIVHACFPVNIPADGDYDFKVVDLPAIERAATIVHRGAMDNVMSTIQELALWIDASGYTSAGYNRELYLQVGDDKSTLVTELQEPLR